MNRKNRYSKKAKISEGKFRELLQLFSLDLEATKISKLTGLNRNTVNRYLKEIRILMAKFCEIDSPFKGEIEVDESYFGAKRIKGKRGRGASSKTIVFGILKRKGKVYTEIVPDCSKQTLQGIIRGKVGLDSVIHSDCWRSYHGLVDLGYQKHFRVNHGNNQFADGKNHINGIEGFWGFAKTRLAKFRGMNKGTFYLHLKECEFRFNHRHEDLFSVLKKLIRKNPLF
jgi:transposase-like protein